MQKKYLYNYSNKSSIIFYSLSVLFSLSVFGQSLSSDNTVIDVDWDVCKYYPTPNSNKSTIKALDHIRQKIINGENGCSTFIVNYNGFTAPAQTAFQFAVDIWSNSIESSIPIRVSATFGPLDPGVLGGAGPTSFRTVLFSGFPSNTVFPIALAEKLTGAEISDGPNSTSTDITATFSSTANFYFGLDGNTPNGQIDFVSVVLHELGHGLGILGFGRVNDPNSPTQGVLRNNGFVNVWDVFIENGTPADITSFADPSVALLSEFTSNDLFSNGPITTAQNGGVKPSTYAPAIFNGGSSYSHWDENTYPAGNANSLMTPFISPGEAIHDPGLVTLGFMEDMGWSICGGSLSVEKLNLDTIDVSPNPFKSSLSIKFSNGFNDYYSLNVLDINGRVVINETKTPINGSITISNLSKLENALYFIKITNENNGASITKKIIKN